MIEAAMTQENVKQMRIMKGMFLLVDRKSDEGLTRWVDELDKRDIPALLLADGHTINRNPDLIKGAVSRGLEVGAVYNDGALWPESYDDMITWIPPWLDMERPLMKGRYETQELIMTRINDRLAPLIGKTMPVFSGKYFSYDENTLKIADKMGIKYILARGTKKERAFFYQPQEFKPVIISVSNVPSRELGTGSLCDESLESRKAMPRDFSELLFNLNTDRIILVAQTHISGLMGEWWDVYQEFFDSDRVEWQALDDFVLDPAIMPNNEIPVNKRVDYMAIHLEEAKKAGEMV